MSELRITQFTRRRLGRALEYSQGGSGPVPEKLENYPLASVFRESMGQTNGWTDERRQRQRERIQRWKPWERSTGPKTRKGKAEVSKNAYKGGVRPMLRLLAKLLREQEQSLDQWT